MSIIKSHDITLVNDTEQYQVKLIPMTGNHLPLLYGWNKKSDILYWCEGDDIVMNEPDDVNSIYGSISEKAYMFIITINNIAVGDCWIQDLNLPILIKKHGNKNVNRIDVTIYEESLWGKGIGVNINSMLLEFGFVTCQVDLIYAITEDYNLRAQKCLTKSGFELDQILEHYETSKGKAEYCYLISKESYVNKCENNN